MLRISLFVLHTTSDMLRVAGQKTGLFPKEIYAADISSKSEQHRVLDNVHEHPFWAVTMCFILSPVVIKGVYSPLITSN